MKVLTDDVIWLAQHFRQVSSVIEIDERAEARLVVRLPHVFTVYDKRMPTGRHGVCVHPLQAEGKDWAEVYRNIFNAVCSAPKFETAISNQPTLFRYRPKLGQSSLIVKPDTSYEWVGPDDEKHNHADVRLADFELIFVDPRSRETMEFHFDDMHAHLYIGR